MVDFLREESRCYPSSREGIKGIVSKHDIGSGQAAAARTQAIAQDTIGLGGNVNY